MRRITSLMSQWKAKSDRGSALHFENSKGGFASSDEEYTLKIYGKTQGDGHIKAGSQINCCGKNLFNPYNMWQIASAQWVLIYPMYKATFTEDKLIGGGEHASTMGFLISFENSGTNTYTLTADCVPDGKPYDGMHPEGAQLYVYQWDEVAKGNEFYISSSYEPAAEWISTNTDRVSYTFTVTKPYFGFSFNRMRFGDTPADSRYNALKNVQLERGGATEYEPYKGSSFLIPCDLYEGDVYLPTKGIVKRQDGSTEDYQPVTLEIPQGKVNLFGSQGQITTDLSLTHLTKRI